MDGMYGSLASQMLRDECLANMILVNLTTTPQPVFPRNPMRFAILIPNTVSNVVEYSFTESTMVLGQGIGFLPQASGPNGFDRAVIGDLICWPFWAAINSTSASLVFAEISYTRKAWECYQRARHEYLSHYTAP